MTTALKSTVLLVGAAMTCFLWIAAGACRSGRSYTWHRGRGLTPFPSSRHSTAMAVALQTGKIRTYPGWGSTKTPLASLSDRKASHYRMALAQATHAAPREFPTHEPGLLDRLLVKYARRSWAADFAATDLFLLLAEPLTHNHHYSRDLKCNACGLAQRLSH
jgi:hypothetical protein